MDILSKTHLKSSCIIHRQGGMSTNCLLAVGKVSWDHGHGHKEYCSVIYNNMQAILTDLLINHLQLPSNGVSEKLSQAICHHLDSLTLWGFFISRLTNQSTAYLDMKLFRSTIGYICLRKPRQNLQEQIIGHHYCMNNMNSMPCWEWLESTAATHNGRNRVGLQLDSLLRQRITKTKKAIKLAKRCKNTQFQKTMAWSNHSNFVI